MVHDFRYCLTILLLVVSLHGVAAEPEQVINLTLDARKSSSVGDYSQAIEQGGKALELSFSVFGRGHANTALIQNDLSGYFQKIGEFEQALKHSQDAFAVIEAGLIADEAVTNAILFNLASAFSGKGEYRRAAELYRSVHTSRVTMGDSKGVANVSDALAIVLMETRELRESIARARESSQIWLELGDQSKRRYIDSQLILSKALLLNENIEQSSEVLSALSSDGAAAMNQSQRAEISLMKARIDIKLAKLDAALSTLNDIDSSSQSTLPSPLMAAVAYNTGTVYLLKGNSILAERHFKKSADFYRRGLGADNTAVIRALQGIALAYKDLGKLEEANLIFQNITELQRQLIGETIPLAESMSEWVRILIDLNEEEKSLSLAERAYQIVQSDTNATAYQQAISRSSLAFALAANNQNTNAINQYQKALQTLVELRGIHSPDLPPGYLAISELLIEERRFDEAERFIEKAFQVVQNNGSITTGKLANSYKLKARLQSARGNCAGARQSVLLAIDTVLKFNAISDQNRFLSGDSATVKDRELVLELLDTLYDCGYLGSEEPSVLFELFRMVQIPQLKSTSVAVSQSSAISSAAQNSNTEIFIEKKNLQNRWLKNERLVNDLILEPNIDRQSLSLVSDEQARTLDALVSVNQRIRQEFPKLSDLSNPAPVDLEHVQNYLAEDEALVIQLSAQERTYLALVTNNVLNLTTTEMTSDQLLNAVESIRSGVDLEKIRSNTDFPEFDLGSAYFLYQNLIEPFAASLDNVRHLLMVSDGPLQRLPLSLLVTEANLVNPENLRGFRKLPYLIRDFAITTLPSASSFSFMSNESEYDGESNPSFFGIGDPVFPTDAEFDQRNLSFSEHVETYTDLDILQQSFSRLKETSDELESLAVNFPSAENKLLLQHEATEKNLKQQDLSDYSVLAFATHGLMSDELSHIREPALVLTPPDTLTEIDNGILTATEVAQLQLNSDWVILSACNTAAPGSEVGADGLSGLAKAFFHAGARALLVTHWWVDSSAAKILTTDTLANYFGNKGRLRKADSLRNAMLEFINGEYGGTQTHPAYWAPFSYVGNNS